MPPSTHPTIDHTDLFARRRRRARSGAGSIDFAPMADAVDGHLAFCAAIAIAGVSVPAALQRSGYRLDQVRSLAVGVATELSCGAPGEAFDELVATGLLADPLLLGAAHERYLAMPEPLRLEWARTVRHNLDDWRDGRSGAIGRPESMPPRIAAHIAGAPRSAGAEDCGAARSRTNRGPVRGGMVPSRTAPSRSEGRSFHA